MNKENKKVNDRELKLIFVLGGIVLFFLIYQFGYRNVQKANENLKSQVDEVRGEVKVMQTMKQNEETYKAYTDSMTQEMQDVMDAIPSEIRSEDKIMFARSLEKEYGFHVTGVGLQTDEMVYEMNEVKDKASFGTNVTEVNEFFNCIIIKRVIVVLKQLCNEYKLIVF